MDKPNRKDGQFWRKLKYPGGEEFNQFDKLAYEVAMEKYVDYLESRLDNYKSDMIDLVNTTCDSLMESIGDDFNYFGCPTLADDIVQEIEKYE